MAKKIKTLLALWNIRIVHWWSISTAEPHLKSTYIKAELDLNFLHFLWKEIQIIGTILELFYIFWISLK